MDLTDLRIFIEPQQGASYDEILAVAATAERLGFGAFFRSDHYLKMGDGTGLPGPTDAWTTLAGLARDTSDIRLGTLVTAATFRLPGPLAITVAGVDQMSGGRVELGLGAGWYEAEHSAYGIPFPDVATRFDWLEEQLAVITGLWHTPEDETFSFDGRHYALTGSPALPKPSQVGGPPIIIGGHGPRRTPALAAQYASEFNVGFSSIETFTAQRDRVVAACESIDRDPATMVWSTALVACVAHDEAGVARRAAAIGHDADELRRVGVAGTVDETVATLRRWSDAGVDRIYLQILDLADLEHLEVLATQVAVQLT